MDLNTGKFQVYRFGLVPYLDSWQLQDRLAAELGQGERPAALLLLEHPHTFTFGRRGSVKNLLWNQAELEKRGVSLYWVDRGGDVTYHGPGQLVGYPIISLVREGIILPVGNEKKQPQVDYIGYLRRLEQVLIQVCERFGVQGQRLDGMTGIWVENKKSTVEQPVQMRYSKLAAIGVKVDARGVTRHGFALNVNPVMEYWQGIVACGLAGYTVTSLAEQCPSTPELEEVMDAVVTAFGNVFGLACVEAPGEGAFTPNWHR